MCFYSSAPGDWVNCGLCGEWAHFGCDRRQGLGAFKVLYSFDSIKIFMRVYLLNVTELIFGLIVGLCKNGRIGIYMPSV